MDTAGEEWIPQGRNGYRRGGSCHWEVSSTSKGWQDKDIVSPRSSMASGFSIKSPEVYPDPVDDKTTSMLGSQSRERVAENALMELFDFQPFPLIAKFMKNRDAIV
ncbi:hypothetical protein D9611_009718 [Ephemerocybe angulata]|uniref:Brr2 N-terminal helicase PWI domain-containing protein n=1 Tax=Ephemerocybe angulata TaxID=980116 RepID=A0A8H5C5J8_9AGAR|nr:hypothetical protein D9611_009718 [Tulosesus angulatus]